MGLEQRQVSLTLSGVSSRVVPLMGTITAGRNGHLISSRPSVTVISGLELFEVYSLVDREPDPGVLHATLEEVQGGAALVYSTNGAKRLADVIMNHGSPTLPAHLTVISISEHAVSAFRNIQVGRIVIAAEPTENAMIAALRDCIR